MTDQAKREKLEAEAREWLESHRMEYTGVVDEVIGSLADWAERLIHDAVAERDREWQKAIGISAFSGPGDVHPAFNEATKLHIAKAVAEEREALRDRLLEMRQVARPTLDFHSPCCMQTIDHMLAILDAQEKATKIEPAAEPEVGRFADGMNASDHKKHCAILTTRDGWEADCTCAEPEVKP